MDTDLRTNNAEDNEQAEAVKHSLLSDRGDSKKHPHRRKDDGEAANVEGNVVANHHYQNQSEPYEQDRLEPIVHKEISWKSVAAILHDALPKIDKMLSQANMPIASRNSKAFNIVGDTMLEVSDWEKFFISEVHGKFLTIINDWYRERYGKEFEEDEDAFFSALLIHGTPFILRVPKTFKIVADEPNMIWVGLPASVQKEEEPLSWIQNKGVVGGLSVNEQDSIRKTALETANMVRSIDFDTRSLEEGNNSSIAQLASSVRTDIQSSARKLCERNDAALRAAAWDASQATEKAIKILIRRKGQIPPHSHELTSLAQEAERLGAQTIDKALLDRIPSGSDATNMRYEGEITLTTAFKAYDAALLIIRQITFEAKPDSKYNIREGRVKLKKPPWFNFDIQKFRQELRQ